MKQTQFPIIGLLLLSICLFSSCASSYKSINLQALQYNQSSNTNAAVTIDYKYNILQDSGNKKYAKREEKRDLNLIAVKITNNSNKNISFAKNIKIYGNDNIFTPIEPELIKNALKQPEAIYLLYSLLFLQTEKCVNNDCERSSYPIGVPIGIGNLVVASSANSAFLKEIQSHNIITKVIKPGETAYGFIGLRHTKYAPLSFKID